MPDSMIQLGALGIVFLVAIREFFSYLRIRKNSSNGNGDTEEKRDKQDATLLNKAILNELRLMNSNHLHSIERVIDDGNSKLITAIYDGNTKLIQVLSEIKGKLER